jgi:hypothetical protein
MLRVLLDRMETMQIKFKLIGIRPIIHRLTILKINPQFHRYGEVHKLNMIYLLQIVILYT